jgi:hypothetical protein
MKSLSVVPRVAIALAMAVPFAGAAYEAAVPYFSRTRNLTVSSPDRQNCVVVDQDVWKFARPDLADLRLYDGQSQHPYALITQSGGGSSQESVAKILNLGKFGDQTEFDLEVGGLNEYGRVRLQIDARNFINTTQVEGRKTPNDRSGTRLASSTLYDFTNEGLGSNSILKFPASSFPYLHVRLAPGLAPGQIKGAYISNVSETKAAWSLSGNCSAVAGAPRQTIFECSIADGMPVERISFELPPSAVNFNRTVTVSDEKGNDLERGAISRVRMYRGGQTVISAQLALGLYSRTAKQIRVTVENGDDPPLPIARVHPMSFERRLYFDPAGKPALQLYYGDPKLEAPSYDYVKFFRQSPDAATAQLSAANANAQFTGRPDDRPWSERHNSVLWLAMLVAVALLGGLALRGLKSKPTPGNPPSGGQ